MTASQLDSHIDPSQLQAATKRPRVGRIIFDTACLILLIGGLGYIGWFGIGTTRAVSRSLAGPEAVVRLQIVNATTDPTLAKVVAGVLTKSVDARLSFAVVDTTRFSSRKVQRSFLVARDADRATADAVAERLGLTDDQVTFLPLEHNGRNVSITLVLGEDYRRLSLSAGASKEIQGKS